MSCRRLLLPAAALLALCLATPAAAAPEPRIVNGALAQEGEYPAQGYLWVDSDLNDEIDFACGGTLVGSRQFLTAAHCVVNALGQPVPPAGFKVYLGHVDLADPTQDIYTVSDPPERHPDFVRTTLRNDVAMITLDRPADYELMRVVDDGEDALWEAGTSARVIGWGQNAGGAPQEKLREADVPIITDDRCAAAHTAFDPEIMVCAAHDPGTPPGQRGDICVGDGGGPLLAREGASYVLAGVAALDTECGDPDEPGVYTRVGDEFEGSNLNSWVHDRIPEADFEFSHAPRANEPVTLTSISRHPEGADYFKLVRWDFDEDRFFDDAFGQSVTHTFPAAGEYVVGIEASTAGGDKTSAYFAFNVAPDPNAPPTSQLAPAGHAHARHPWRLPSPRGSWRRSTRPSARRSSADASTSACASPARRRPASRSSRSTAASARSASRAAACAGRHAPDQRQAHADGQADARPQRHQAPEAQGAGARRPQRAALEDADRQALVMDHPYRIERYRSSSQGVTWTR